MIRHNKPRNPGATSSLSLKEAPLSTPLRVEGIKSGSKAQSRLASMGIVPGVEVLILHRNNSGPLLLEVKGTRVALGQGIGEKVLVSRNGKSENV